VVVTGDVTVGLKLAFLQSLVPRRRRTKHMLLEFWLNETPGVVGQLRTSVRRFAARSIHTIVCSSSAERARYAEELRIPLERIRFIPFHVNEAPCHLQTSEQDYILSAGRSGRDYAVLLDAARRLAVSVVIVSDRPSLDGLEIPANVRVLYDVEYRVYLDLLASCRVVVVPLQDRRRSSGQVAILDAMGCGKPVLVSRTPGSIDYIDHGVTGILVPPRNAEALAAAIVTVLSDPEAARRMGQRAREVVCAHHRLEDYVHNVLRIADEGMAGDFRHGV